MGGPPKGYSRAERDAAAHRRRVETALSGIGGFCRGLDGIRVGIAALNDDERQTWARHARSYARHLSQFARVLLQEPENAEAPQD